MIVDEVHDEHPELIRDQYWDDNNFEMPYTAASAGFKAKPNAFMGSTIDIRYKIKQLCAVCLQDTYNEKCFYYELDSNFNGSN